MGYKETDLNGELRVPQHNEGRVLHLECLGCEESKIAYDTFCSFFLSLLCQAIGMTEIRPPDMSAVEVENDPQKSGVTGTLQIAESHIAIHTWPENKATVVHLYTCKDRPELVEKTIAVSRFFLRSSDIRVRINQYLGP